MPGEVASLPGAESAINLRSATDADDALFFGWFVASRSATFKQAGWGPDELQQFLTMQFELQERAIAHRYPDADCRVVQVDGDDCGRLVVSRLDGQMHLVDIVLAPTMCGRGIGSGVLRDLCDEAQGTGRTFTLNVEQASPAVHLYRRFGFVEMGSDGVYMKMRLGDNGVTE